ncbi:aspartate/glutamate racemase family protein [Actinocorallia lasiicapitis]
MTSLLVINPNTARTMTALIGRTARAVASPGTTIEAITSPMGPASIESHYDEALAVPGILAAIGSAPPADGYVIACFGDPGLDAARELAAAPVLGTAQAALHTAALLGRSFSIVTTLARTVGRATDLVHHYGFDRACAGIHACDVPVLDVEDAYEPVAAACRLARDTDRPDSLVLGCAGMAAFCGPLSAALGLPVIDGVAAAVKLAESLAAQHLTPAGSGEFARPPAKPYSGLLSPFAL